jgi:hypothetical protein
MKNKALQTLVLSITFAFALSIGVTSCKKDKDEAPKPMTSTVNGTSVDFSTATAEAVNGMIGIDGMAKDSSYIMISIPGTVTDNTKYNFNDLDMYYYDHKKNVIYAAFITNTHGTVTVNSHDKTGKKISGKFEGVMYGWTTANDSLVLTNGQFNLTYK